MDLYTKFNRKNIDDRQIDTLIGISKGLLADGVVNETEAQFLLTWLIQSRQAGDNPIIRNLLEKVQAMLQDGRFDSDESQELSTILRQITGAPSVVGELAKASSLPIDRPPPAIIFAARSFLFTGTCVFGNRRECYEAIESLGGIKAKSVTRSLDYLVLGTYVTDSWAHETYGRKIELAMQHREQGARLAIVTEEHWIASAQL